jgi:hypothetical protein
MMKLSARMLVIACLALGLSACGGGSESSTDWASSEVVAQVNGVCAEWRDAVDARGDFPVDDFDPEHPTPEALPAVGEYFASANAATEKALASLRDLDAPEAIRAELDALTAAMDTQLASAKRQVEAARRSDVDAFVATLDAAGGTTESVDDAADALGADDCSFR